LRQYLWTDRIPVLSNSAPIKQDSRVVGVGIPLTYLDARGDHVKLDGFDDELLPHVLPRKLGGLEPIEVFLPVYSCLALGKAD
jgi:hypothetical protein